MRALRSASTLLRVAFAGVLSVPGCSEGPAASNPDTQEARKKIFIEENQSSESKGKGKGTATTDLKNIKARTLAK